MEYPFHINTPPDYQWQPLDLNSVYSRINSNLTDLTFNILPPVEILQHYANMMICSCRGAYITTLSVANFEPIQKHIRDLDNNTQIPPNAEPYGE